MTTRRRTHFAAEKLSKDGQAVVRAAVHRGATLEQIVAELKAATGEDLAVSSLHRWMQAEKVRDRIERRQQAVDAALAMVSAEPDGRMARMIGLVLEERLLESEDKLGELEFEQQLALWQAMGKTTLLHKKLALGEREVAAEEKKADASMLQAQASLKVAEAKLEAMRAAAETAAKGVQDVKAAAKDGKVPVEALDRVMNDIYGLRAAATEDAHA